MRKLRFVLLIGAIQGMAAASHGTKPGTQPLEHPGRSISRSAVNVQCGLAQEASLSLQPGLESEPLRRGLELSQNGGVRVFVELSQEVINHHGIDLLHTKEG